MTTKQSTLEKAKQTQSKTTILEASKLLSNEQELLRRFAGVSLAELEKQIGALKPKQLEQFSLQTCKKLSSLQVKNIAQRFLGGFLLFMMHAAVSGAGSGGFAHRLRLLNFERRTAYRWIDLFKFFAPHNKHLPELFERFSIGAAQLLAASSTSDLIKHHFIERAKTGHDIAASEVKEAIAELDGKPRGSESNTTNNECVLEEKFQKGVITIHTVIAATTSREELQRAFNTAFNTISNKLPSSTANIAE